MKLLCERIVNEILPSVRSLVANELQDKGYSQTEIAGILDITQPAVSQYLSASRGKHVQHITNDEDAYEQVQELVQELTQRPDDAAARLHDVCVAIADEECVADCEH